MALEPQGGGVVTRRKLRRAYWASLAILAVLTFAMMTYGMGILPFAKSSRLVQDMMVAATVMSNLVSAVLSVPANNWMSDPVRGICLFLGGAVGVLVGGGVFVFSHLGEYPTLGAYEEARTGGALLTWELRLMPFYLGAVVGLHACLGAVFSLLWHGGATAVRATKASRGDGPGIPA